MLLAWTSLLLLIINGTLWLIVTEKGYAIQTAKQIINRVSDKASWDEIMYEFYVKQKITKGLAAIKDGRTISHKKAKKRLLGNAG